MRPGQHRRDVAIGSAAIFICKPLLGLFRVPDGRSLEVAKGGIDGASLAGAVLIQFDRFGQRILDEEPLIVCLRRDRSISDLTPPLEGINVDPNSKPEWAACDGVDGLSLGKTAVIKANERIAQSLCI